MLETKYYQWTLLFLIFNQNLLKIRTAYAKEFEKEIAERNNETNNKIQMTMTMDN